MSGTPFTVYDSAGVSLQGGAPEISGFPSDRPNVIGDSTKGTCQPDPNGPIFVAGTADCWIGASGFQRLDPVAQAGQFGNAGRNIAQGPEFQQWDFSALKNFRVTESRTIQFRGEFFNIFNRANLGLPGERFEFVEFRPDSNFIAGAASAVRAEIYFLGGLFYRAAEARRRLTYSVT